jgi:hypothetical protein
MTTTTNPTNPKTTIIGHRFTVGTITDKPIQAMLRNQVADVCYSSPPWDDAKCRQYSGSRLDWSRFFDLLVKVIAEHVNGYVFLEGGVHTSDRAAERLSLVCKDVHVFPTTYSKPGMPSRLLVGHTSQSMAGWRPHKEWLRGKLAQPFGCVGSVSLPGQTLLDPVCTNVYSAQTARRLGLSFYGNDHNPRRAEAIRRILAQG